MLRFRLSKRKISYIVAFIILFASFVSQLFKPTQPKSPQQNQLTTSTPATSSAGLTRVVKVLDGDTIKIETGQKVRYIGVDTPELHHPKKKLQCFGKEARDKNRELVEGKLVRLEKDVSETDRFWRLLRYVYVITEASPSGEFVNDYLIREGFAHASTFPPDVKYSDHFINLENQARQNQRGLWNRCK